MSADKPGSRRDARAARRAWRKLRAAPLWVRRPTFDPDRVAARLAAADARRWAALMAAIPSFPSSPAQEGPDMNPDTPTPASAPATVPAPLSFVLGVDGDLNPVAYAVREMRTLREVAP